ncbi:ornithine decarboxylase-like isoform X1 [Diorhabda sublineata]|uniref:ornithine decarboxylase-like isoform X1 n=1 Tax=Diorhabda sublineata TaxID=1163346 RepID=UPI0024E17917|nr:ornithine decarboxylase-like isoform X1 [Diorhabda sublineata]
MFYDYQVSQNMEYQNTIQVYDEEKENVYSIINKIINDGEQKEGFFLCNVNELILKYREWKRLFPNVDPFYAVKCNDSRIVLEIIAALGLGFSCVSKEEIRRIISLNVPANKIIFANPTKKISHIVYAATEGVDLLTFDNEHELYKISDCHPSSKLIMRVCTKEPNNNGVIRKFGALPGQEVHHLLTVAKSLNLNIVGVVFHVENPQNIEEYTRAIEITKMVFNTGQELGYNFNIVDIGGGFSGAHEGDITNVAEIIRSSLSYYFQGNEVKFVAEPGRYFVETAFKLVSYIHSKRTMSDGIRMYHLDIGVYSGLAPIIFKRFFTCKPLQKEMSEPLYPSILWGPTCDSTDKISEDIDYLPLMDIGEWFIFENTGAYTLPITYEFNGFTLPAIHSVISKSNWLYILENASVPVKKSKFIFGNSMEIYMSGLNNPYIFNRLYY